MEEGASEREDAALELEGLAGGASAIIELLSVGDFVEYFEDERSSVLTEPPPPVTRVRIRQ